MCSGTSTVYDDSALSVARRMQRYVQSNDVHNCVKLIRDVFVRKRGINYFSRPARTRTCVVIQFVTESVQYMRLIMF